MLPVTHSRSFPGHGLGIMLSVGIRMRAKFCSTLDEIPHEILLLLVCYYIHIHRIES